ncbi:NGP1NT (NUC091) domain [Carpediemonas membranifera]|uniref:Nucleolar GTP-binding protein 2 n=1 Tax=Carpediemonas membranifera TaxID=201153 RepID=A0A8J6AW96_9EUKA|nr:NGP1NT (NUC091) domain [Carpediemonas membranifera]|eukprot:KAG9396406.1 NGP1NT (NUC091) domain [Carpediemonas membranifera]
MFSVAKKSMKAKQHKHGHTKQVEKRLKMYNSKQKRDSKGKIISGALVKDLDKLDGRIAPNRMWFENTRVIGQKDLATFREEMEAKEADPYSMVVRHKKLPTALLADRFEGNRVKILEVESFDKTFGKSSTRKRPKLANFDMAKMVEDAKGRTEGFEHTTAEEEARDEGRHWSLKAGQSRRILAEFYKVIDSSDVVVQVLDARDPMGTRSKMMEKYMKQPENAHRKMIFVINKSDLVSPGQLKGWVNVLRKEHPTVAFHTSLSAQHRKTKNRRPAQDRGFGVEALQQLLEQMPKNFKDRKTISVSFVGYPNTGKSSIINTLKQKTVCSVAPIAGETKVWQYVSLTQKIFLIDSPGIVSPDPDLSDADIVLRGVVRSENIDDPAQYVGAILERAGFDKLVEVYDIKEPMVKRTPKAFMKAFGRRRGRLIEGGKVNIGEVAKIMIDDYVRGVIPWSVLPPGYLERKAQKAAEKAAKEE